MKKFIYIPFFSIISLIAVLPLQGCDWDWDSEPETLGSVYNATAKQVDMTVIIPIHPSSLKYLDYVINYTDNMGAEHRDTVQESTSEMSFDEDFYYTKRYSYTSLPVVCNCEVTLIPKVSRESRVSFAFINPKPYIFNRVIFNSHSTTPQISEEDMRGVDIIKIDDIELGTFLSAYGSYFHSVCAVKIEYDGIQCTFY